MNLKHGKTSFSFILILLFLQIYPSTRSVCKEAPSEVFLSFGMNKIEEHNKASSRSEALKECLTDAVRQYVAKSIPKRLFEENNGILLNKIYNNYNLFLQNYRIKEEREDDGYYKITAEVSLNTHLLIQKLNEIGFTQEVGNKPSLVILVSDVELMDGNQSELSWWVKEDEKNRPRSHLIHEKFEKRLALMGFPMMDKTSFISRLDDAKISLKRKLIKVDIDTIRRFNFGDILILGTANMQLKRKDRKAIPESLLLSIAAINLHDGSKLIALQKEYNINEATPSLKNFAENPRMEGAINSIIDDFSSDLAGSFLAKWYQSSANITIIGFDVRGIFSYNLYRDIKGLLEESKPEVISYKDSMMQKGVYSFKLEISCQPETLAKKIIRKKIGGYSIEILKVTSENITIGLR